MKRPKVYVIVVTYRAPLDAIECFASLFASDYGRFSVIACDNSMDDSTLPPVWAWAQGKDPFQIPAASPLRDRREARMPEVTHRFRHGMDRSPPRLGDRQLLLLDTGSNRGFAAANNLGVRYAVEMGDADYFWILNPDTVVEPGTLGRLVAYAETCPDVGLLGTYLVDYDKPQTLQAIGGAAWDYRTATASRLGAGESVDQVVASGSWSGTLDLLVGASMFVSRAFIEDIGPMDESYFLYCEEIDWAHRARGRYAIDVAPGAIVYHKEVTSQKTGLMWKRWFYFQRARLLFTARRCPRYLPSVSLAVLGAAGRLPQYCASLPITLYGQSDLSRR